MKAKNGKSLSAQCAGAGAGAGAHVPTRVSERGEWVKRANRTGTKGGAQSEREGAGAQKEGVRRRNKGRRERKPASFRPLTTEFEMRELFVAGNSVSSKENAYFCKRINTTLPFSAAIRRPYSAKSRNLPDEPTQMILDFR